MKYEILHNGPYLTIENIRPYINRDAKHCIYSVVPGTQGILKINCAGKIMSKSGNKMPAVVFDRGVEVMIVTDGKCPFIISKSHYERLVNSSKQSVEV